MTDLADAIHRHKVLTYLDLSSNQICNQGFKKLFQAISQDDSQIKELHLRANLIGGDEINSMLFCDSVALKVLDL